MLRHVRPKFSCRGCEAVTQAPAPSLPIRRGRATAGLLAHVLVAKYADHLPLYRQSEIYAREGLELQRSTLADWVGQSAALLRPLIDALARHVLAGAVLHADDTPVPVLAPGLGKTSTGRLWAYLRDERPYGSTTPPAVLYRYSPDRRAEHPKAHLAGFRGVLQADGYSGFDGLYDGGQVAGGGVLGACPALFLRVARHRPGAVGDRGGAPHRPALRHRAGHPRPAARRAGQAAPGQGRADPREPACLARRDPRPDLRPQRSGRGHPLCPEADGRR